MRALAARHLAQGDFVYRTPDPPLFVRAEGVWLYDSEGRAYLDGEAANGTAVLGYDGSLLDDARSRIDGTPSLPSFCESPLRLRVAARLAGALEEITGQRGRVAFELGGAQGIELALKIALHSRPKANIAVFEGAYHGRSLFTSHLSASSRYRAQYGWNGGPTLRLPYPDCGRCRFGLSPDRCAVECGTYAAGMIEEEFAGCSTHSNDGLCAFIFEPVLNVGGMVSPDPRYLRRCVESARRQGALIIADEIFTGMHRTGPLFGFQRFGLEPDIVVFSKGLTNGICPLSCVWSREPIASPERFPPGTHSVTHGNSQLALALADTVLDRYESENVAGRVHDLAQALEAGRSRLEAVPGVRKFDVVGGIARIVLSEPVADRVKYRAMNEAPPPGVERLLVASTAVAPHVVSLHPSLVSTPREVASMLGSLEHALRPNGRD